MSDKAFEEAALTDEQRGKCFLLGVRIRYAKPANNYYAHQVQSYGANLFLRGNGYNNSNPLRFATVDEVIAAVTNMKKLGVYWGL